MPSRKGQLFLVFSRELLRSFQYNSRSPFWKHKPYLYPDTASYLPRNRTTRLRHLRRSQPVSCRLPPKQTACAQPLAAIQSRSQEKLGEASRRFRSKRRGNTLLAFTALTARLGFTTTRSTRSWLNAQIVRWRAAPTGLLDAAALMLARCNVDVPASPLGEPAPFAFHACGQRRRTSSSCVSR